MSLRLLQKQVGQESEERKRQLGHGPTRRGGRGGWLNSKPRQAPLGRAATHEPDPQDRADEAPGLSRQTAPAKGRGKGAGRGSSSFLSAFTEDEDMAETAYPSSAPARSSTSPPTFSTSVVDPAPSQDLATSIPETGSVPGLTQVLESAQLARCRSAADAWCEEQGAANIDEIAEVFDEFVEALALKPLEKRRLDKALNEARQGSTSGSCDARPGAIAALNAAMASGSVDSIRKALDHCRQIGCSETDGLKEAEQAIVRLEATGDLHAAIADGADAAWLQAAIENAEAAGVAREDVEKAAALLEALSTKSLPEVEGLRAVFEEARLQQFADAACQWCSKQQLQTCEEVASCLEALGSALKFKPLERKRLAKALEANAGRTPQSTGEKPPSTEELSAAQRKLDAQAALSLAANGEDIDTLAAAIQHADSSGVHGDVFESAKERLEALRQEALRRSRAEERLVRALKGTDVDELQDAMSAGRDACINGDVLAGAQEVLTALQAQQKEHAEALAALKCATGDSSIEALASAIAQAANIESLAPELAQARSRLNEMKEEQHRKQAATEELQAANEAEDIERLSEAISNASQLKLEMDKIHTAQDKLSRLKEEARKKSEATLALSHALELQDEGKLEDAISLSEHVLPQGTLLVEAKKVLFDLKAKTAAKQAAEENLKNAIAQGDLDVLKQRIMEANSNTVSKAIIQQAEKALERLTCEAQATQQALHALEVAIAESDPEALALAIGQAEEASVDSTAIMRAKEKLEAVKEQANLRINAERALMRASHEDNLQALQDAIKVAEDAHVCPAALEEGRRALHVLENAITIRDAAKAALKEHIKERAIEDLTAAILHAEKVGVEDECLDDARQQLLQIKDENQKMEEAYDMLAAAAGEDDIEELKAAIHSAEQAGVTEDALDEARQVLETLIEEAQKKDAANSTLQLAVEGDSIDALRSAIAAAEEVGVSDVEIQAAKAVLCKLSILGQLALALKQDDKEVIETLIRQAEEAGIDDDAVSRAHDTLAHLKAREEKEARERQLMEAMERRDLEELSGLMASAQNVDVDSNLLVQVRSLCEKLQSERERQHLASAELEAAMEAGDMERLSEAIGNAKEAAVSNEKIADANEVLTALQQKRDQCEATLLEAVAGDYPEAIKHAVILAEEAGVSMEIVTRATWRCRELEELAERREHMLNSLQQAKTAKDLQALRDLLAQAKQDQLGDTIVVQAEKQVMELERAMARDAASESLLEAMRQKNEDILNSAILKAEQSGVDSELVANARDVLTQLRREAQSKQDALDALLEAARKGDIDALEGALDEATKLSLDESLLTHAKDKLAELQEAKRNKEAKDLATKVLVEAIAGKSVQALSTALEQAEKVGSDSEVLRQASERLQKLDLEAQALKAVQAAVEEGNETSLSDALLKAEEAGVTQEDLQTAREKLSNIQEANRKKLMKAANTLLQGAMKKPDIPALEEALGQAQQAGVDAASLEKAHKELDKRKAAAEKKLARETAEAALQVALDNQDKEELRKAIVTAEKDGVGKKTLGEAKRVLANLEDLWCKQESAIAALKKADESGDVEMLQQAVQECESAGVTPTKLEEARHKIASLEEDAERKRELAKVLEALKVANVRKDKSALQAGLASAEKLGAQTKDIEQARKTLEKIREKEEKDEATADLKAATSSQNVEKIKEAIALAEKAGIPKKTIEQARKTLASLEEEIRLKAEAEILKEKALDDLKAAIESNVMTQLEDAVTAAEKAGVENEELAAAKCSLLQLQKEVELATLKEQALDDLKTAMTTNDMTLLGNAVTAAEKAGIDKDELAAAKRSLFQLQKEKREQAKKDKSRKEALEALEDAVSGKDLDVLKEAIQKAKAEGLERNELGKAFARQAELVKLKKREVVRLALEDFEYAVTQNDIEAASLALEEAEAEGAGPEELARAEQALSDLRNRLDPEGEQRRKRLEARKTKDGQKKWNFAGKSNNAIINDRFREHEAALEQQRRLAFRGRGRFRGSAEDEGEEGAERNIKKERAEVAKEKGFAPLPDNNVPTKQFQYGRSPKEETEAPRKLTLRADVDNGPGLDHHASWWGMIVDGIDPEPGQPGLRLGDALVEVNSMSLRELEAEDCEQRFADFFCDGCSVTVEPHVCIPGFLSNSDGIDQESLKSDLQRFAADWSIEIKIADCTAARAHITLEGPQTAVKESKPELEQLMQFYVGA